MLNFNVSTPRGESKVKGFGLHSHRGKIMVNQVTGKATQRSKRSGSGLRRRLGDHITDTSTRPDELQIRFTRLEEEEKKKRNK